MLRIANTVSQLQDFISERSGNGKKIAFVPTMGALHKGHISLINRAKEEADIVVCSIFVNPTQFTDPKDLEKYPRPLEHDIKMLDQAGTDVVFMPSVLEMYPEWPVPEKWDINLGQTEFLLEGAFRKGHYQGVTQIVKKLFDAVGPHIAYFGQKDFQQVLMIRKMVGLFNMPVEIISCPIVREDDGLAMSSRNIHLSAIERQNALILSKALQYVSDNQNERSFSALTQTAIEMINNADGVVLEYFTIADTQTLLPFNVSGNAVALVAAKVGNTRLIDNMLLG
ncbi:MAG: pantoate--beta-alanine ligase [Pedobacter sp.]|nr:MAG: pantoate--beta-alanine ligase [Pedobacter sp.]